MGMFPLVYTDGWCPGAFSQPKKGGLVYLFIVSCFRSCFGSVWYTLEGNLFFPFLLMMFNAFLAFLQAHIYMFLGNLRLALLMGKGYWDIFQDIRFASMIL